MALRDLNYQIKSLALFDDYLTELVQQKRKADKIADANTDETDPDLIREVPDFPVKTWEALKVANKLPASRINIPYSPRVEWYRTPRAQYRVQGTHGRWQDFYGGIGSISSLRPVFGTQHGFCALGCAERSDLFADLEATSEPRHPYRQMFDVLSGNRVKLMEKNDHLNARDVSASLCVMLLMLQASNRENKDSLKMFRDRGDVHGFFPLEGDQEEHALVRDITPNLDIYDLTDSPTAWPIIKDSLGNALRLIRPVVVMDEGHRAVSELAFATLYGFNPCFVLELTATPKDVAAVGGKKPKPARYANVLVEVKGIDLDREGMIKMPLNLDPRQGTDWRNTLSVALDRLNRINAEALRLQGEQGRYIRRPIMLVQVQRTGSDQRDGVHIHALDVKDWLRTAGLDETEIAIKTADTNDLADPENQDLLSPANRVRVIITKQALQEGWDCPFAYVLCALAASGSLFAMTQLVGRILRQPYAQKTGVPVLDECYVITHHADTADVVTAIKKGLEEDGLGDLVKEIRQSDSSKTKGLRKVKRREKFIKTEIFLPQVLRVETGEVRPLDYEQDILFALDWSGLDVSPLVAMIPSSIQGAETQMRRIRLADVGDERIVAEEAGITSESLRFDPVYAVRMISDIVSNAWVAREIVGKVERGLIARGFDPVRVGEQTGLIVEELRKWLDNESDRQGEIHFKKEVAVGRIQFRLRADGRNWRMPLETDTFEPEGAEQLVGKNGAALERSLFAPIFKNDFTSQDERDIAVYLDGNQALHWWHRNVARNHFSVQGWRREKIYPDFIFALQHGEAKEHNRLLVLEMKGEHLSGNPKTEYVKKVLNVMSEAYETASSVGKLELVEKSGTTIQCDLVLMSEWKTKVPEFLS